jgi:hypothetical protein
MPRFLHVANGHSTTTTITAAGIPGATSIWADPLHDGPVPADVADDALIEIRAAAIAAAAHVPAADVASGLRDWRRRIAGRASYDELVLWFEHDLFDQLNLIQLLAWIHDQLPDTTPVSLICIGSFPGRPSFKGLGELTPGELAPLFDRRQPVTGAHYTLAARAWHAFRLPTPEVLAALRASDTAALPYLAPAFQRFLEEYPWTRDGLSRTERQLLALAADGPHPLMSLWSRMARDEQAYYVTDTSLVATAAALSAGAAPLLRVSGEPGDLATQLRQQVQITEMGRTVLAGELDWIAVGGIDRWLGGVHLHRGAPLWRWDAERQTITQ